MTLVPPKCVELPPHVRCDFQDSQQVLSSSRKSAVKRRSAPRKAQSVDRATRIIKLIGAVGRSGATLQALSKQMGFTNPMCRRLLLALVAPTCSRNCSRKSLMGRSRDRPPGSSKHYRLYYHAFRPRQTAGSRNSTRRNLLSNHLARKLWSRSSLM